MLFNSPEFIFIFLPITLVVFFLLGKIRIKFAALWLLVSSLFFYGWWNPIYLALLVPSIIFNYLVGFRLAHPSNLTTLRKRKWILIFGISINLAVLAYFKYANFFLDNLDSLFQFHWDFEKIALPIGISFFTFTQIAFLVDAYHAKAKEYNPIHYGLFVTYFPHLIAGPILHHQEMMPQFENPKIYQINHEKILAGFTVFCFGLFKKVMIADPLSSLASPVFALAKISSHGTTFLESWIGVLAYTFQIYFDFSGYCDMAIGLSLLFGIKLPINFNSPYKSINIIDFWRRWHMTLSRFLRDYLYIPLGGNRDGSTRRYINLFITMLLGGLWHGANWTFIIWGALHGIYLTINHAWKSIWNSPLQGERVAAGRVRGHAAKLGTTLSQITTLFAVVIAWVFFRADNLTSALRILKGMFLLNSSLFATQEIRLGGISAIEQSYGFIFILLSALFFIVLLFPNTQEIMAGKEIALDCPEKPIYFFGKKVEWKTNFKTGLLIGIILFFTFKSFFNTESSEFLYFNF